MNISAFTGSAETEEQLRIFAAAAETLDSGVPRSTFSDSYMWKVMTEGRANPGDRYAGSKSLDDTGGFFEVREDDLVYLTDKAKECVKVVAI